MRLRIILSAIITLALATTAQAAPSITGSPTVSSTEISISGTGFGTKTVAEPLVYDNFESGSNGQQIPGQAPLVENLDSWTVWQDSGGAKPTYSTARVRTGTRSTKSSYHPFKDGLYSNAGLAIKSLPFIKTWYFSFYWYYDNGSGWSTNTKPWFIDGSGGSTGREPHTYLGFPAPSGGNSRIKREDDPSLGLGDAYGSTPLSDFGDKWVRIEAWHVQSDTNVSNGKFVVWYHFPNGTIRKDIDNTSKSRSSSRWWTDFNISSYSTLSGDSGQVAYLDDFYFDSTTQRVEIGNASTWSACTHREVQVTSSWSNTAITVDLTKTSLEDGNYYLFVVDDTNTPSAGAAITLNSEGGDETAPTVTSASVDGTTVTVNFSETVVTTGYDAGDLNIDCTTAGSNISLTSPSGSGASRTFTAATSVGAGDTCNLDYVGSTDDIEDSAGNDLAQFSDTTVTVNTSTPMEFNWSSATYSVNEGDVDPIVGRINRTGSTSGVATLHWSTSGVTASGTTDYAGFDDATLNWADGESYKDVQFGIYQDVLVEGDETTTLTIFNPSVGSVGSQDTATLTIVDDDSESNPIDGVCGFNDGAAVRSLTSSDTENCSIGAVSDFSGTGPWSWTCDGAEGGDDASCSAYLLLTKAQIGTGTSTTILIGTPLIIGN